MDGTSPPANYPENIPCFPPSHVLQHRDQIPSPSTLATGSFHSLEGQNDRFTFTVGKIEGVNMYAAYNGNTDGLDDKDQPMFHKHGPKATYIMMLNGTKVSQQKYALFKKGFATKEKVAKQIAEIAFDFFKGKYGKDVAMQKLKSLSLLGLERTNKSAYFCIIAETAPQAPPIVRNTTMPMTPPARDFHPTFISGVAGQAGIPLSQIPTEVVGNPFNNVALAQPGVFPTMYPSQGLYERNREPIRTSDNFVLRDTYTVHPLTSATTPYSAPPMDATSWNGYGGVPFPQPGGSNATYSPQNSFAWATSNEGPRGELHESVEETGPYVFAPPGNGITGNDWSGEGVFQGY